MADLSTIEAELQRRLDPKPRRFSEIRTDALKAVPRIICADGFNMSVQAGAALYCSPRDSDGPWYSVEVGFPSGRAEVLMPFAEEADRPTKTVYGWVPLSIVAQVVADHGGFASSAPANDDPANPPADFGAAFAIIRDDTQTRAFNEDASVSA